MPGAARRMYPARTRSLWLGSSASAGSSRRVRTNRVDIRMSMGVSLLSTPGPPTRRPDRARWTRARSGRRVGGPGMLSRLTPMLMRMSTLFVRTLREDPADAEVPSHRLLVRAGYIRRAAPGIYTWLPLGLRVLAKVEQVVREEMAAIGAQEVHFPALLPREPYEATGRWTEYG